MSLGQRVAVSQRMDAETRDQIASTIRQEWYKAPILCTPEELMEIEV